MRALNRAVDTARTEIVQQAKENYWVTATDVRKTIKITKASKSTLRAVVDSKATRRELINFKVSPKNPRPKNPPKLKVAVKKEGGLKDFLNAFVIRGRSSGKLHVVTRTSDKRYPIHMRYGPSVPEMIGKNLSRNAFKMLLERKVKETYDRRLIHEIRRTIEGGV
jgi:hypothetical protein